MRINILLVDDRSDGLLALEAALSGLDYNLVKAASGAEAIVHAEEQEYAVILMDVQMPHMNGFQTANMIKRRPICRDTPIIFVTAINKDYRYVREGYEAGAVDYLFKPFDVDVLRSKVAVFAEMQRKNLQLRQQTEELRLKDAELHQARKLEAVGRLAGGVAHDFNNLVTGILGISEELRSQFSESDPRRQELEEIIKASHRAFGLTKQLLAFGRRQVISPKLLDLNAIVADLQPMMSRLTGEDIELKTSLQSQLRPIKIDPSQLEQVIFNLVLNARDAIADGGTVEIGTETVRFGPHHENFYPGAQEGVFIALTVKDNGCGMPAEILDHIFEPFFTTKDSKGTGLGLATVYGIVKQNEGEVFVRSEAGKGSVFTVLFPEAAGVANLDVVPAPSRPCAGEETVLVVEDEDIVRRVLRNLLARNGYKVLEAADGQQALTIAKDRPGAIDLVITDVVMPGMNGRQLAGHLRETHPHAALLYISAYSEDVIARRGILEPGIEFLEKSAISHSLLPKVRGLLDHRLAVAPFASDRPA